MFVKTSLKSFFKTLFKKEERRCEYNGLVPAAKANATLEYMNRVRQGCKVYRQFHAQCLNGLARAMTRMPNPWHSLFIILTKYYRLFSSCKL